MECVELLTTIAMTAFGLFGIYLANDNEFAEFKNKGPQQKILYETICTMAWFRGFIFGCCCACY